jgi:hypothetical protein
MYIFLFLRATRSAYGAKCVLKYFLGRFSPYIPTKSCPSFVGMAVGAYGEQSKTASRFISDVALEL